MSTSTDQELKAEALDALTTMVTDIIKDDTTPSDEKITLIMELIEVVGGFRDV